MQGESPLPRLLVVDDEPVVVQALCKYLRSRGFAVDGCGDLAAATELLLAHRHAVVIADLRLSSREEAEGLELLRRVADLPAERVPRPRVVLLSAHAEPAVRDEAFRLGADAFLLKPLPLAEIAGAVQAVLAGGGPPIGE
jgi:CheY-like chemotaxis protein